MQTSLTDYEMKLVTDAEILLAKNKIIQTVYELFGKLSVQYKSMLEVDAVELSAQTNAKISRGENYKGLPWVVLDYPRGFGKEDVMAIRSFFWWGNFFSITLQLAGKPQHQYGQSIETAIKNRRFEGWHISQSTDPWQHHFEDDNYGLVDADINYQIAARPYLKMAKKIPLTKWDQSEVFFKESFIFLISLLTC
jgi:hypothetical protein